jgi:TRAP-type C4-dicarboxylate transport system permease small subunit
MEEITGHTAVWLYMIGAAYGTYERSHIKAEFIHLIIKNPVILKSFRIFASVISIVICIFMAIWSYEYVNWSMVRHEVTPALHWPTVYFQIPILISSLLMTLYFFIEMVDLARNRIGHQTKVTG